MRRALSLSAVLMMLPGLASAAGPVVGAGVGGTVIMDGGNRRYEGMVGGGYKVGFEVGSRHWRNEWAFNQTVLNGDGYGYHHNLTLSGFSYQLSFHVFEHGFSPYVGAGLEMGLATMKEPNYSPYSAVTYQETSTGGYLRPYAALGARYFTRFGLGLRAEVTAGSLGETMTLNGNLAVSYSW